MASACSITRKASSGCPASAACKPAVRCASNSACNAPDTAGALSSGSVTPASPRAGKGHTHPVLVPPPMPSAGMSPESAPSPVPPVPPASAPSSPSAAGLAGFGSSSGRTKGLVEDTPENDLQARWGCGAGAFGDFANDPTASLACDPGLDLSDAEVGRSCECLDLGYDPL